VGKASRIFVSLDLKGCMAELIGLSIKGVDFWPT